MGQTVPRWLMHYLVNVGQDNMGNYVRGDYHHFKNIGVKRDSDDTRHQMHWVCPTVAMNE
jgi:hypothetical protein